MVSIEKYLARQKGDFRLFALFLREGSPGKWEGLVSANWLDTNKQRALKPIIEQLSTKPNKDELMSLSHVVIFKKDNEGLSAIKPFMPVKPEMTEFIRNVLEKCGNKMAKKNVISTTTHSFISEIRYTPSI
jgi:hypothetical protein